MAQADAEDGFFAQQVMDGFLGVVEGLGIAGAVRQEHAGRIVGKHFLGRGGAGQDGHAAARVEQPAGDVPLHAVIQGDNKRQVGNLFAVVRLH